MTLVVLAEATANDACMASVAFAPPQKCAAPCRLDHTLTQGIISGLGRELATPGAAWHQAVELVPCHAMCLAEVTHL